MTVTLSFSVLYVSYESTVHLILAEFVVLMIIFPQLWHQERWRYCDDIHSSGHSDQARGSINARRNVTDGTAGGWGLWYRMYCLDVASPRLTPSLPSRLASRAVGQWLHSSFHTLALATLCSMLPGKWWCKSSLDSLLHGETNCGMSSPPTSLVSLANIFLVWPILSTTTSPLFMSSTSMWNLRHHGVMVEMVLTHQHGCPSNLVFLTLLYFASALSPGAQLSLTTLFVRMFGMGVVCDAWWSLQRCELHWYVGIIKANLVFLLLPSMFFNGRTMRVQWIMTHLPCRHSLKLRRWLSVHHHSRCTESRLHFTAWALPHSHTWHSCSFHSLLMV